MTCPVKPSDRAQGSTTALWVSRSTLPSSTAAPPRRRGPWDLRLAVSA